MSLDLDLLLGPLADAAAAAGDLLAHMGSNVDQQPVGRVLTERPAESPAEASWIQVWMDFLSPWGWVVSVVLAFFYRRTMKKLAQKNVQVSEERNRLAERNNELTEENRDLTAKIVDNTQQQLTIEQQREQEEQERKARPVKLQSVKAIPFNAAGRVGFSISPTVVSLSDVATTVSKVVILCGSGATWCTVGFGPQRVLSAKGLLSPVSPPPVYIDETPREMPSHYQIHLDDLTVVEAELPPIDAELERVVRARLSSK